MNDKKTKVVKCDSCGKKINVGKFASKKQKCADCTAAPDQPSTPREKLAKAQRLLSGLGFVQSNAGKYSKTYSDVNGITYRVEPYFHKGAVSEMNDCTIEAFQITSQKMIMVKPTAANQDEQWAEFQELIPDCTREDMLTIWNDLVGSIALSGDEHQATDSVKCSQCGKASIEFVLMGSEKKPFCLKCSGYTSRISMKSFAR